MGPMEAHGHHGGPWTTMVAYGAHGTHRADEANGHFGAQAAGGRPQQRICVIRKMFLKGAGGMHEGTNEL